MTTPVELQTGVLAYADASYIFWSTYGLAEEWGSYCVMRASQTPKKEDIELPNSAGVQSGLIQLIHGSTWNVTVRDDSRMTPPAIGDYVTLMDRNGDLGAVGAFYDARVLTPNFEATLKQPGERVLVIEHVTLIDG